MNTCHVMKAEALACGSGVAGCRLATSLSSSGRRELLAGSSKEKNVRLRVEFNNAQKVVRGENGRDARIFVCRSIGGGKNLYQPFRPPISVETPAGASSTEEQLEILRERRGLWHEYANLVPLLTRAGFTPSMIDEATGMTGVEQNMILVASQVRGSLKQTGLDEENLQYFDIGGAELLYELRILSATQRKASAMFIVERKMGPKEACELARSVKDFDRRKNSEGFKEFTTAPGDCLAFACYRQSKEYDNEVDIEEALRKALDFCVSDKARAKIEQALKKLSTPSTEEAEVADTSFMQVIRLLEGEVVGTKLPTMLPVAEATLKSLEDVPALAPKGKGPFNVFSSDAVWPSWVALPGWDPIVSAKAPVAVLFPDPLKLPLQSNKNGVAKLQEPTLVIVDKSVSAIDDSDSLYVVAESEGQDLFIKYSPRVLENRVLGKVILALKPPTAASEDPDDWE